METSTARKIKAFRHAATIGSKILDDMIFEVGDEELACHAATLALFQEMEKFTSPKNERGVRRSRRKSTHHTVKH